MSTKSEGARQRAIKARGAARYIGCGRTKLKELIASGAFPGAFKLGRDHVLPVEDLDAFVDAQAAAARAARSKAPFVEPPPAPLIADAWSHSTASTGVPPSEADGPHPHGSRKGGAE
jgi:predicted DNA-binding transcriptional regulator AlpA